MKSFILLASAASLVRAAGLLDAHAAAGLGASNDGSSDAKAELGLGLNLPEGVLPDNLHLPVGPPDADHTKTWHPPHPGVIIDGCDEDGNDEWHYVHPCKDCNPSTVAPHVWTTSTVPAYPSPTVVKCADCASGMEVSTVTVPPAKTVVPVAVADPPAPSVTSPAAATSDADPAATSSSSTLDLDSILPTTSTEAAAITTTSSPVVASSAPSQGFLTYTAPAAAQPSSGAPIYRIPTNQTTPVYTPPAPAPAPAGCVGEGCRPIYSPIAAGPAPPTGTGGAVSNPTIPVVVSGASRQSVGALLFAGAAAVALLL